MFSRDSTLRSPDKIKTNKKETYFKYVHFEDAKYYLRSQNEIKGSK